MYRNMLWFSLCMVLHFLQIAVRENISHRMWRKYIATVSIFLFFLSLPHNLLAEDIPKTLHKLAREQPTKIHAIQHSWNKFDKIAQHYAQKHGIHAIDGLLTDASAAIYAMEVFPGYFRNLSQHIGGAEATQLLKATLHNSHFLVEFSTQLQRYRQKPRLFGLLIRSHGDAKNHLFTDLEIQSGSLVAKFIEEYIKLPVDVRREIIRDSRSAFFLMETKIDGMEVLRHYGTVVMEIASYYEPGHRKEVIRYLRRGGQPLIDAFKQGSIVGWRVAVRFPKLYHQLSMRLGVKNSLGFLHTNAHYIASHLEDPSNPYWISSVTFEVQSLLEEGILPYTQIDPMAFALCLEVQGGKKLMGRLGSYMPASLLYRYYPRHKAFLCQFLNRYGVAPLKVLYEYSKKGADRARLERVIDKCGAKGLLLVSYAYSRDQTMKLLLEDGFDRGHHYLHHFKFDRYGIPSRSGYQGNNVPELVKVTTNYFWYGSKPSWQELGIAAMEAVELIEFCMTMGSAPSLSKGGKMVVKELAGKYTKTQVSHITYSKMKKIARKIAWKTLKKVVRKELRLHKFGQLQRHTPLIIARRMGNNFVEDAFNRACRTALSEFLSAAYGNVATE